MSDVQSLAPAAVASPARRKLTLRRTRDRPRASLKSWCLNMTPESSTAMPTPLPSSPL